MCSVRGCDRRVTCRGYCNVHYQRWHRLGDPLAGGTEVRRGTPSERFWPKVDKTGDCWLWTGTIDTASGYGRFRVHSRGSMALAHRFAWTDSGRPLGDGQQLDHLCRVRRCVRPDHLEIVTNAENVRRGLRGVLRPPSPPKPPRLPLPALRTHCPQGHAYDEANTYRTRDGRRCCRECGREAQRRYKKRTKCP